MSDADQRSVPQKRKQPPKKGRQRRFSRPLRLGLFVQFAILGAVALLISASRSRVAGWYQELGVKTDIYAIPQEDQLVVFSLGYRAAMADLLFGRTMVAAGVHFAERRVFHHLDAYLKGILALDPKYLDVYMYADTLLNLSTVEMPKENLRIARDIQERGLKEFPHEPDLWLSTGQYIAFLAPQRLPENEDPREWRLAGARILQHACDIWPRRTALPGVCLTSATLFSREGETDAAIRSLERLIAVADDEELRAQASQKLQALSGQRAALKLQDRLHQLDDLRTSDLPVVGRMRYQLLVPPFDEQNCSGLREPDARLQCATSFYSRSSILAKQRAPVGD